MKKNQVITLVSAVSILAVASNRADAQMTRFTAGSDEARALVQHLVEEGGCKSESPFTYLGLGSRLGSKQLDRTVTTRVYSETLMSEPLAADFCDEHQINQFAFAQDSIILTRTNRAGCGPSQLVKDVEGYESDAPAWAEAIQLVYGGRDGKGDREACLDARRLELVSNWYGLLGNECTDENCTRLRYAFRPGDNSGATAFMMKIAGIKAFCNGLQHEDKDPLRTDCSLFFETRGMEYCPEGSRGVVQAIDVPPNGTRRPITPCSEGNYEFGMNFGGELCPDLTDPFSGFLCVFPLDCNNRFGCANAGENTSPLNPFVDGRPFNYLQMDGESSTFQLLPLKTFISEEGRYELTQYQASSIYSNRYCNNGEANPSSHEKIGCLVSETDCSIGFGGRGMLQAKRTSTFQGESCLKQMPIEHATVALNGESYDSPNYPVPARYHYYNARGASSFNGRLNCSTGEDPSGLCECIAGTDPSGGAALDRALEAANLLPMPGGPRVVLCGEEP